MTGIQTKVPLPPPTPGSLADIISQGGTGLDNVQAGLQVQQGLAGLPPAMVGDNTWNLSTGENMSKPTQAIVTVGNPDGTTSQYALPNNYVSMNNRIYKFENGKWIDVSSSGGIQNINLETGEFTQNQGSPARFDFAGNPLGQGGQVYTTPGTGSNPTIGAQYNPPGGAPYSTDYFFNDNGNANWNNIINTGALATNPIRQTTDLINSLGITGINISDILSNPEVLRIILQGAGVIPR
jgi:hypothetical protein